MKTGHWRCPDEPRRWTRLAAGGFLVFFLLGASPAGQGGPPGAGGEDCDANALLQGAKRFMREGGDAAWVLRHLETAATCATAGEMYELNIYLSLARAHSDRIEEAMAAAERAGALSDSDSDLDRASALFYALKGSFCRVTFALADTDPTVVPVISIEEVELDPALPVEELESLFPARYRPFVRTLLPDAMESAEAQMAKSAVGPLKVWLPHGEYRFSDGQVVHVGGESMTLATTGGLRWSRRTFSVGSGFRATSFVSDRFMADASLGHGGVDVVYAFRLRRSTHLVLEAGYFPGYVRDPAIQNLATGGADVDGSSAGGVTARELNGGTGAVFGFAPDAMSCFGVGLQRQVPFMRRGTAFLPGLLLRFMDIGGVYAPATGPVEDSVASDETQEANYSVQRLYWVGVLPTIDLRLERELFRLPGERQHIDLVVGVSGGTGPGWFLFQGDVAAQGAEITLSFLERWMLAGGGYLGLSLRTTE